ncbi:MAG TPA: Uma2 family endonuclease [Pirellulales bacterium]|nr:Uma2 family endonuclease [Pirellulales bacterium]
MSISVGPPPGTTFDPLYPDSDGEPVGETEYHFVATCRLYSALALWYRLRNDVHVAGDMLLYYEEGNPSAVRGPGVMVSKGVRGKHFRRSFRTWEEGVVPTVIFEITSLKTRDEDEGPKPRLYASLGVREYFMFDPQGEYLRPCLQGFSLSAGQYKPMTPDANGQVFSQELGLRLLADGYLLRLVDPATGKPLPTEEEYADEAAKARREADAAHRQVEMLEAELERLRAGRPPSDAGNA